MTVAEIVEQLDKDIDARGALVEGSQGGSPKPNPAVVESRHQRIALGRLMADIDRRLGIAAQGGSSGFRGPYVGDGTPYQRQRGEAAERRRAGKISTPGRR